MGILDFPQLLVGALAVALLAVATELVFARLERALRRVGWRCRMIRLEDVTQDLPGASRARRSTGSTSTSRAARPAC